MAPVHSIWINLWPEKLRDFGGLPGRTRFHNREFRGQVTGNAAAQLLFAIEPGCRFLAKAAGFVSVIQL
jgi:hypothetical protein